VLSVGAAEDVRITAAGLVGTGAAVQVIRT
jgi:hypothetical protein